MQRVTHKQRWDKYRDEGVVTKSERYAKFTLPSLMIDTETAAHSSQQVVVERDYQELGALLVNNLATKLGGLLFPPNRAFFEIELTSELMRRATMRRSSSTIRANLARMELDATQQLFRNASYSQLILGLKHLVVTGNLLTYRDSELRRSLSYGVNQFVCRRDGRGLLLDCVLREYTYFDALDPETQTALVAANPARYQNALRYGNEVRVAMYTRIWRSRSNSGKSVIMRVSQEVEDVPVGKPGSYPEHLCPWQVITWSLNPGEHYGRGLVEDYAGGFAKLSDISHAMTLYGIEALKLLNMVTSGSGTDVDRAARAETGEWITGDPGSVSAYEAGSDRKLVVIKDILNDSWQKLSRAFMYTGNVRDAERVTAYELRRDAYEAENTLGGAFSSLAETWQIGLGHLLLMEVEPGILEGIVTKAVRLDLKSGISALGRSAEVQNILEAVQDAAAAAPILQLDPRVSRDKLYDLMYAGRGVDTETLFKSAEEVAEQEAADRAVQEGQQQLQNAALTSDVQQALQQTIQQGA